MKATNTIFLLLVKHIYLLRLVVLLVFLFCSNAFCNAQNDTITLNKKRLQTTIAATSLVYAGTLYGLNNLWYSDFDRSSFHYFNDNQEWKQMDKLGHVYSSYLGGSIGYHALKYSNLSERKSVVYGGGLGFLFLSTVEVFDGYSKEWGFSWGDVLSNGIGTSLFMGQQLLFEKQIVQPKYSYSASDYRSLRPEVLGESTVEAYFKDYNAQTYWFSVNLNSINNEIKPEWLNLAVGYGANGMVNSSGCYHQDGLSIEPYRQYYVSLDADLTKIRTENKWLKSFLKVASFIKIPAPTLELNQNKKSNFYWLFF